MMKASVTDKDDTTWKFDFNSSESTFWNSIVVKSGQQSGYLLFELSVLVNSEKKSAKEEYVNIFCLSFSWTVARIVSI